MIVTAHDIDVLARTCYGEGRGGGYSAMRVPAWVAANRARSAAIHSRAQFGDGSIAAACLAHAQFSCWLESDPNRAVIEAVTLDNPVFQIAYFNAIEAAQRITPDPTGDRLFYWSNDIPTPAWAVGKPTLAIGPFRLVADA